MAAIAPFQSADAMDAPPMHIPDGFLSAPVALILYAAAAAVVALAVWRTNKALEERTAPLMGVLAAFIFAGQMMNFPVAGGTSGHMLGGALASLPSPACAVRRHEKR